MTLAEIRQKKQDLENEIRNSLIKFEKETEVSINSLEWSSTDLSSLNPLIEYPSRLRSFKIEIII